MAFTPDDIQKVRQANDLVEVFSERNTMRQRGRDFWCCCPFHQEKTPSCKVDPATQTWHCFGCGEGGDVFTYIEKLDDVGFSDAVRFLARRGNVDIKETAYEAKSSSKKSKLKEVCAETARFYHMLLMRSKDASAQRAREYLSQRGLGGPIPNEWNLGFAPGGNKLVTHLTSLGFSAEEMVDANVAVSSQRIQGNQRGRSGLRDRFFDRVMFPINDVRGDVIAFGGRIIGTGEPKYLNTGDTLLFHKSEVLYGLDKAKASMAVTGDAIICEGYTDVIALHEAGFSHAVATLGTALTRQHIRILSHHAKQRIIYLFDGDAAGQRAADRALGFIDSSITPEAGARKVGLFAVTLPDGLDPADFLAQKSPEDLTELLNNATPLLKYGIDRRLSHYDLATPEGRGRAVVEALSILAPIKDSLLAKDYAVYIASKTQTREEDVLQQLASLKVPAGYQANQSRDNTSGTQQSATPAVPLSPAEKNRLRTEREFLSLCAQNPAMIENFMPTLAQTNWHESVHQQLAEILLDIIAKRPNSTAAELISAAQTQCPYAHKVLTASVTQGVANANESLVFLEEELRIGDLEQIIVAMKAELANFEQPLEQGEFSVLESSPNQSQELFQSIIVMQEELNKLRARHRQGA